MTIFEMSAILTVIAAIFGYINHRVIKLPSVIGLMTIASFFSLTLIFLKVIGISGVTNFIQDNLSQIDLENLVLEIMLPFLLFAGALHVNLNDLFNRRFAIFSFATISLLISSFLIGVLIYFTSKLFGNPLPYVFCFLFGALISPTDPIAVLGVMRKTQTPDSLKVKIVGESLFNDGFGVVIFLIILRFSLGSAESDFDLMINLKSIALFLLQEVAGGILLGLIIGSIGYFAMKTIDDHGLEILISVALVIGSYSLARNLHLSAPLTIVVVGLLIGNHGRHLAMSEQTRKNVDTFWELIDELLNAILFLLIGFELVLLPFNQISLGSVLIVSLCAIPIVLFSRLVGIGVPITILRSLGRQFSTNAIRIITWAGLRGGISLALALSIPEGKERNSILIMTYTIVVFSILVQGLTLGRFLPKSS